MVCQKKKSSYWKNHIFCHIWKHCKEMLWLQVFSDQNCLHQEKTWSLGWYDQHQFSLIFWINKMSLLLCNIGQHTLLYWLKWTHSLHWLIHRRLFSRSFVNFFTFFPHIYNKVSQKADWRTLWNPVIIINKRVLPIFLHIFIIYFWKLSIFDSCMWAEYFQLINNNLVSNNFQMKFQFEFSFV